MGLRSLRFLRLLFTSLALGLALAHLSLLRPKMRKLNSYKMWSHFILPGTR